MDTLRIPQLSANVEEAAVTGWLKQAGEPVRQGEPVVELTTEKACFECDAPAGGVLRQRLAEEKSVLPVGYIIALIGEPDEALPDVSEENAACVAAQTAHTPRRRRRRRKHANGSRRRRVRATPAARRVARELGVDLADVAAQSEGDDPVSETQVRDFAGGKERGSC